MSDPRRFAGMAGVVLAIMMAVAFMLDFAIMATTGGPPQLSLDNLAADLVRAQRSAIWPIEAWLYTLQIVPFAIFILGVRAALKASHAEAADVTALAALLFSAAHTLHNLAILTVVQYVAPVYAPGAPTAASLEAVARGLIGLAYATFLPGAGVGSAFLVIALASFAIAQRRPPVFPAWSGRLARAGAVLVGVAYLQYVLPPAFFIALFGYLAFIGWTAVVAIALMRDSATRTVLVAQPA